MTPGTGGLPRPRRPAVPVAATVLTLVAWGVVAHDSGAGWVQTVGAVVAGVLVVGLVGPLFAVSRARATIESAPADAAAGFPFFVEVRTTAPLEVQAARPPGPSSLTGRELRARLEVHPAHRGVLDHVTVVIASAAPFGLLWWTRTLHLALPRPVAVAPRTGEPDRAAVSSATAETPSVAPGHGVEPRGVRPYEHGDRRHLVHWPATAHAGTLMVRETERPSTRAAVVRAVLPYDLEAAEREAERAMGTVAELLRHGITVQLVTAEPDGERVGVVASAEDAGRRLAAALPRPVWADDRSPSPPHGRPDR